MIESGWQRAWPSDTASTDFNRDRRAALTAQSGYLLRITPEGQLLLTTEGDWRVGVAHFPCDAIVLGYWKKVPIAVVERSKENTSLQVRNVRDCLPWMTVAELELVSTALEVLHWQRDHRYCGRCGHLMTMDRDEYAMHCTLCQHRCYPRLSPCIIALVTHGDDMLLARGPHFPPGRFSTLAGFIEPGENAEQAVCREIYEEVGLKVDTPIFQRSQSWPFPHSFMLGFTVQALKREFCIDGCEIEAAGWFSCDQLPELPPRGAISRWLIDQHIDQVRQRQE